MSYKDHYWKEMFNQGITLMGVSELPNNLENYNAG
jgi:hypothetical protein